MNVFVLTYHILSLLVLCKLTDMFCGKKSVDNISLDSPKIIIIVIIMLIVFSYT